jgi:hypothetical protein
MELTCLRCSSSKVVPNASVWDQGPILISVAKNPAALLMKGTVTSGVHARVCGDCGHTELVADNPTALYDAHRASKS